MGLHVASARVISCLGVTSTGQRDGNPTPGHAGMRAEGRVPHTCAHQRRAEGQAHTPCAHPHRATGRFPHSYTHHHRVERWHAHPCTPVAGGCPHTGIPVPHVRHGTTTHSQVLPPPASAVRELLHGADSPIASLRPCIRSLGPADFDLLEEVPGLLKRQSPEAVCQSICAGAVVEGRLVCVAQALGTWGRYGELWVATEPAARRQGYATACACLVIRGMAGAGLLPVFRSQEDDWPALKLAHRLGFKELLRRVSVALEGKDGYRPRQTGAPKASAPRPQTGAVGGTREQPLPEQPPPEDSLPEESPPEEVLPDPAPQEPCHGQAEWDCPSEGSSEGEGLPESEEAERCGTDREGVGCVTGRTSGRRGGSPPCTRHHVEDHPPGAPSAFHMAAHTGDHPPGTIGGGGGG